MMLRHAFLLSCLLALIAATPAQAEYFFSEHGAEKVTKDAAHKKYGYNRYAMGVFCRPQGAPRADSAFKYHRWACTWAASDDYCDSGESSFGQFLIVGHSGAGSYGYKVLRGAHCDSV